MNKSCSLKMCRKCCIKSPFPCTVIDHKLNKEKTVALEDRRECALDAAESEKPDEKTVKIMYQISFSLHYH